MTKACLHCGDPIPVHENAADGFCCQGCAGAYGLVNGLGLTTYYERRTLNPDVKSIRPDEDPIFIDYKNHILVDEDGIHTLYLMVEGIHCAACVWLIETVLAKQAGVFHARVNMSTRRLVLKWKGQDIDPNQLVGMINGLGYRLVPFDPSLISSENEKQEKELLRAMAVAGFAAGNVMLFSISVWAGGAEMSVPTRDLMHWLSALVGLPAVAYSGRVFFRSALTALISKRLNMDVPISLAVILAAGMSLYQVVQGAQHTYFDSSISLLFFLLIGRYLDRRARSKARGAAEQLLGLNAVAVTVLNEDGSKRLLPPQQVKENMVIFCAAGERITVDGIILEGKSDIDTSLISGETIPSVMSVDDQVFAGTTNLSAGLKIRVNATGEATLLAEIVRLMEEAEGTRAKYVSIADRIARYYAPVVHLLALFTFIYWIGFGGLVWNEALLNAIAVLIITCPCALALAVPVVQVIASSRLMRQGILVKTGTALERFARVKDIVFDKTGTLTLGRAELINAQDISLDQLSLAVSLAGASKHPLSRALCRYLPQTRMRSGVVEVPGCGLQADDVRLGSREWCGNDSIGASKGPELWLSEKDKAPVCFQFSDELRSDAVDIVANLQRAGYHIHLFSGDRTEVVRKVADELKISHWQAACRPIDKCDHLTGLDHPLMVGDGLNDAPALSAAYVSLSPSTAIDVSQNTADAIFQGDRLKPVLEILLVAKKCERLIKQNFFLAFLYNGVTIPLAITGYVTPLFAAVAMSTSSLIVIANALRLSRGKV